MHARAMAPLGNIGVTDIWRWTGLAFLWPCLQASGFYPLSLVPRAASLAPSTVAVYHTLYSVTLAALALVACLGTSRLAQSTGHGHPNSQPALANPNPPRWLWLLAGACGVFGHALLTFVDPASGAFSSCAAIAALATSLFVCLAVIGWGCLSARSTAGPSEPLGVIVSYALSQAAESVWFWLDLSRAPLYLVCPVASCTCGWLASRAPTASSRSLTSGPLPLEHADGATPHAPETSPSREIPWHMIIPALLLIYFCVIFTRLTISGWQGDSAYASKAVTSLFATCFAILATGVLLRGLRQGWAIELQLMTVFAVLVVMYLAALGGEVLIGSVGELPMRRLLIADEHCLEVFVWIVLVCTAQAGHIRAVHLFGLYVLVVIAIPWFISFDVFYLTPLSSVIDPDVIHEPALVIAMFSAALAAVISLVSFALNVMTQTTTGAGATSNHHQRPAGTSTPDLSAFGFTDRERDIATLLHRGYSAKKIADVLCLSEPTVKKYATRVYRKVGVHSR